MKPETFVGAAAAYATLSFATGSWPFGGRGLIAGAGGYGGGGAGYGGGGKAGGGAGGYKGTPGWYTGKGHHHCNANTPGCVCTDPKKCLGHKGTGSQYCAANPRICTPRGPGTCDAYYAGDVKDCHYCPPGTATGKCAGKGGAGGAVGKGAAAFAYAANYYTGLGAAKRMRMSIS